MTIIFSHIPKCGGTSFRFSLEKAYGERARFYYFNPVRHRAQDKIKFHISRHKRRLLSQYMDTENFDIIYGHFCFDDIIPNGSQHPLGLFLREPIDWLGSFIHYHRKKYPGEFSDDPIKIIKKLNLSDFFKMYLGRYSITDMDFIGISEFYADSLMLFSKQYSIDVVEFNENLTVGRPQNYKQYFADLDKLDEVEELMQGNIEIYNQGLAIFHERLAQSSYKQ